MSAAAAVYASPERDDAIDRLLAAASADADVWTFAALRRAAGPDADLLFGADPAELVEAWSDLADRRMLASVPTEAPPTRLSERVATVVMRRLAEAAPHRDAVRRGLGVLALPRQTPRATRILGRTVDAIWHAAGDRPEGIAVLTKRATLAGVYSATLLYWVARGDDPDAVRAFLDRRLAGVASLGKLRRFLAGGPTRPRPR